MKSYRGLSPFTSRFRRKPIANNPHQCRVMCVFYFRETRKRFCFVLPGLFEIKELDKLDDRGHIKTPGDYDVKTYNRLFQWAFYAASGIEQLEMDGTPVIDFTKENLREAIDAALRRGGVK